jgi:hypothetical protein
MSNAVALVGVAAVVSAGIAALPLASPHPRQAIPQMQAAQDAQSERNVVPSKSVGVKCSERAWPYYESDCLLHPASQPGAPRKARLITVDRIELK